MDVSNTSDVGDGTPRGAESDAGSERGGGRVRAGRTGRSRLLLRRRVTLERASTATVGGGAPMPRDSYASVGARRAPPMRRHPDATQRDGGAALFRNAGGCRRGGRVSTDAVDAVAGRPRDADVGETHGNLRRILAHARHPRGGRVAPRVTARGTRWTPIRYEKAPGVWVEGETRAVEVGRVLVVNDHLRRRWYHRGTIEGSAGKRPTRGIERRRGGVDVRRDAARVRGVANRGDPTQEPRGASARGTSSGCVSVARRRDGHLWEPHVNATMKRERARDGAREQSHHRTFALSSILSYSSPSPSVPLATEHSLRVCTSSPEHPKVPDESNRAGVLLRRAPSRSPRTRSFARRFSRESTTRSRSSAPSPRPSPRWARSSPTPRLALP